LSIAIRYGASKRYAPTHNLVTYHRILFIVGFGGITLPSMILNQVASLRISFSPNSE
jgi:hypothetical protein